MPGQTSLFISLLLGLLLSFSAAAETVLSKGPGVDNQNGGNQATPISFAQNHQGGVQKNQLKYKFAMVFTSEDLITEPYRDTVLKGGEEQLLVAEYGERIIGFYIQSFF